ncbi:MAG: iron chelate uptake ABC transporter family permease subunit [Burkholderiaceae bacterium]
MRRALWPWLSWLAVVVLAAAFVFAGADWDFGYVIPKRLARLSAMAIGGVCVALSSIVFQTLVGNRILTPAVMGYEAVHLLWQALWLWLTGAQGLAMLGLRGDFVASMLAMLAYSWVIHRWLLRGGLRDAYRMLLLGLVLTMVIGTFTQFVQLRISPGEFAVLQGLGQASFNRARPETLLYAATAVAAVCVLAGRTLPVLDVLALGREQAISLGVSHARSVRRYLALIAILAAVSTSLVGPTAFMGIFVAHIAYALAPDARHRLTLPLGCAVAIALFIAAQLLVEHAFNYRTTVGILVNLVGGTYFLALMMRTRGAR